MKFRSNSDCAMKRLWKLMQCCLYTISIIYVKWRSRCMRYSLQCFMKMLSGIPTDPVLNYLIVTYLFRDIPILIDVFKFTLDGWERRIRTSTERTGESLQSNHDKTLSKCRRSSRSWYARYVWTKYWHSTTLLYIYFLHFFSIGGMPGGMPGGFPGAPGAPGAGGAPENSSGGPTIEEVD